MLDVITDTIPPGHSELRQPWRELMPVHPAAEMFPLMNRDEGRELADDIEKNGLREKVELFDDRELGQCVVDGRTRLDALELLGRKIFENDEGYPNPEFFSWDPTKGASPPDPFAYVVSKNLHRRHLIREQRREVTAKLLKANPEISNRQIAAMTGVDHHIVATVRLEGEAGGEISHQERRVDKRGRVQPAQKPKRKTLAEQPPEFPAPTPPSSAKSEAVHSKTVDKGSAHALAEFKYACKLYLPKLNAEHLREAIKHCAAFGGEQLTRLEVVLKPADRRVAAVCRCSEVRAVVRHQRATAMSGPRDLPHTLNHVRKNARAVAASTSHDVPSEVERHVVPVP